MNFAKFIQQGKKHYNRDLEHFYHLKKFLHFPGNHSSAATIVSLL